MQIVKKTLASDKKAGENYRIVSQTKQEIEIEIGSEAEGKMRSYTVSGLSLRKLFDFSCTLKLSINFGEQLQTCLDSVSLNKAKSRNDFVSEARESLKLSEEVLNSDMSALLEALEVIQRKHISQLEADKQASRKKFSFRGTEEESAIRYLSEVDVIEEVLIKDTEEMGYVGDVLGKKVLYLAATSRLLSNPLSVLSVANSAAGKSFAQETILSMMPSDEYFSFTRLTPKSLSHFGRRELMNKILSIDEIIAFEDEALSQLRSLLSKKMLSLGFPQIDKLTGSIETVFKEVYGPVAVMSSTTNESMIDDEIRNRFLILSLEESKAQTERVMKQMLFSATPRGLKLKAKREKLLRKYQAMQKVLKPLQVSIRESWQDKISFNSSKLASKRYFNGYMALLYSIALHRQYQKEKHQLAENSEYIFLEERDVKLGNELMNNLATSTTRELSPVYLSALRGIENYCKSEAKGTQLSHKEVNFTRRDIREALNWEQTPIRRAMKELEEMEYIERTFGSGSGSRHYYRLSAGNTDEGKTDNPLGLWCP